MKYIPGKNKSVQVVLFPDDHQQLKIAARRRGMPMHILVMRLIRAYLKRHPQPESK